MKTIGPRQPEWRAQLAPEWQIREFLKRYHRIAVVGMPADEASEAMVRAQRLLAYEVQLFPVHSAAKTLLGQRCFAHLHDVPGDIDIVLLLPDANVSALHVATEAIRKRVRVFWVEDAPVDRELAELLMREGIHVVAERSLEKEFANLQAQS